MPELEGKVRWFKKSKDIFAYYSLNAKLDKLLQRRVWLESGAYLMIDQTEALTVIDVNTGKFTGKTRLEETILHTNREAAFEIARQIRLRGIGGIIIIDFIDMDCDEDRQKVLDALSEAVKQDRVKTNIVGFTGPWLSGDDAQKDRIHIKRGHALRMPALQRRRLCAQCRVGCTAAEDGTVQDA